MKHILLNLKRFDVPSELGGVNRLAPVTDWAGEIVRKTQDELGGYDPKVYCRSAVRAFSEAM